MVIIKGGIEKDKKEFGKKEKHLKFGGNLTNKKKTSKFLIQIGLELSKFNVDTKIKLANIKKPKEKKEKKAEAEHCANLRKPKIEIDKVVMGLEPTKKLFLREPRLPIPPHQKNM